MGKGIKTRQSQGDVTNKIALAGIRNYNRIK